MVMTPDEYAVHGQNCPVCRSPLIEGERVDVDGTTAWGKVACNACKSTWTDVFDLVGYDELIVAGTPCAANVKQQ